MMNQTKKGLFLKCILTVALLLNLTGGLNMMKASAAETRIAPGAPSSPTKRNVTVTRSYKTKEQVPDFITINSIDVKVNGQVVVGNTNLK